MSVKQTVCLAAGIVITQFFWSFVGGIRGDRGYPPKGGQAIQATSEPAATPGVENEEAAIRPVQEEIYGEYTFRVWAPGESSPGSVDIMKGGRLVKRITPDPGYRFTRYEIGTRTRDYKPDDRIKPGDDITGDGRPNVVIIEFSGGAHCCLWYHILELGKSPKILATISGLHANPIFEDVDGDGVFEVQVYDWTFAYWRACFFESPAPRVILQWQEGKYRVAPELMWNPAPPPEELKAQAESLKREILKNLRPATGPHPAPTTTDLDQKIWRTVLQCTQPLPGDYDPETDTLPAGLWGEMLELIYTGHEDRAWAFLEAAWPEEIDGKENFLRDFRDRLEQSPYWQEMKAAETEQP